MASNGRPFVAIAAVIVIAWFVATQSTSTAEEKYKLQSWQYKVNTCNRLDETALSKDGSQGWEMVTIDRKSADVLYVVYKRKSS